MDTAISNVNDADNIHFVTGARQFFSRRLPAALALELNQLVSAQFQDNERAPLATGSNEQLELRFRQMQQQWPECIDPGIALFKLYFRTGRYFQAECEVWQTMALLSARQGFSRNYRRLQAVNRYWLENDSDQRQFLFCMKALGVIRLRRGKIFLALKVLGKLAELDPFDEIGGSSFWQIAQSFDE